jgi:predicted transcriptional regulator
MAYARNGAAIIEGVVVPKTEMKVLETLNNLGKPVSVPEIAAALKDELSDASIYTLLARLKKRGRLVERQEVAIEVHGTMLRRVLWSAIYQMAPMESGRESFGKSSPYSRESETAI